MFCRYCGKELADKTKFCSSCGKKIPANPADGEAGSVQSVRDPSRERGNGQGLMNPGLVIAGFVLAFLFGGAIMFALMQVRIFGGSMRGSPPGPESRKSAEAEVKSRSEDRLVPPFNLRDDRLQVTDPELSPTPSPTPSLPQSSPVPAVDPVPDVQQGLSEAAADPVLEDFGWLAGSGFLADGRVPADGESVFDFAALSGRWKCCILYSYDNAVELNTVDISGSAESALLTLNWHQIYYNGEAPVDESANAPVLYKGSFDNTGSLYVLSEGSAIESRAIFTYQERQYFVGDLLLPSGEREAFYMVRP